MPDTTIAEAWLQQQPNRRALFTDIDNTLVRSGAQYSHAAQQIREYTTKQHIPLILVTGLSVNQVLSRIEAGEIPMPEVICGAVGTEIWMRAHDNIWQKDAAYALALHAEGFDTAVVQRHAKAFIATVPQYDFVLQPKHAQSEFKVSLHCMADPAQVADLQQKAAVYFAPFKIVVCQDITAVLPPGTERQKFCVDVVPATKGDAVTYLLQRLDVQGGWKAGDSGNDLAMLLQKDSLTPILVGGYTQEAGQVMLAGAHHKKGSVYKLANGQIAYIETESQKAGKSIMRAVETLG